MKQPGLEQQIKKLTKPLERIYRRKVVELAPKLAAEVMEMLTSDYKYHDITGNATTGWYFVVYVRGELVYKITSMEYIGGAAPTRKTLRKGEVYKLPTYWGGDAVEGKPYVGQMGRHNYYAYKRAFEFIRRHKVKYARKNRLVVLVGNGTEYSYYNPKIASKLTEAQLLLKNKGFEYGYSEQEIPF